MGKNVKDSGQGGEDLKYRLMVALVSVHDHKSTASQCAESRSG